MTENEAIKDIRMKACNDRYSAIHCSDNCMFGEYKCSFQIAIDALEEIQAYRAIGTVEEVKQLKENGAFTGLELAQIWSMQQKLKEYKAIGTVEEVQEIRNKAIDEFTEKLMTDVESFVGEVNGIRADLLTLDYFCEFVGEIAEQMKGGAV